MTKKLFSSLLLSFVLFLQLSAENTLPQETSQAITKKEHKPPVLTTSAIIEVFENGHSFSPF